MQNNKITLCLIDDDDIFQFTFKRLLRNLDFIESIIMFSNGAQALEYFQEKSKNSEPFPEIIFVDINMPIMDGWQFIKEYKNLNSELINKSDLYLLSSSINPDESLKAKEFQVIKTFLIKPISVEQVVSLYRNYHQD